VGSTPKAAIQPAAAAATVRRQVAEGIRPVNHMIGREHQDKSVTIAFSRELGGNRNRRAGVSPDRLEHYVSRDAALAQLFGHHEAKIGLGDHYRAREQVGLRYVREHLLEVDSPGKRTASACLRARLATAACRCRRT
jgi:hypothetical protein